MSDTLGILYELRACYSRFDERQAPYYRALSEAIETMHNLLKQREGSNMRLIDADALLDRIPNPYEQAHVARWVNEQPTVSTEGEGKSVTYNSSIQSTMGQQNERCQSTKTDTIYRQAAIDAIDNVLIEDDSCKVWFKLAVGNLPTAERKGHWTIGKDSIGHKRLICTLCGNGIAYMRKFDYCPNCGARMDGEQ